jgi:phosphate/sulfate permease
VTSYRLSDVLLLVFSVFFGMNMGGAGFSPTFSAAIGAKQIKRVPALLLFTLCVGLGSYFVGGHVAKTLGGEIVPAASIDRQTALIVIASASCALFLANFVKVPESTSWVTVFGLMSLGLMRSNLNTHTIVYKLLPAWILVPATAFVLTWAFSRQLYPLRGWNYRLYEHLSKHEWKLRLIVIVSACYLALAAGANNVANVVGPLASAGVFSVKTGMLLFTPIFGLGAAFLSPGKTIGRDVVPLGLYSAAIINLVVGSLMLFVSWLGISQSLVQAHVLAVFAIAFAKEGSYEVFRHKVIRRILIYWIISPLLAATFVAVLLRLFGR